MSCLLEKRVCDAEVILPIDNNGWQVWFGNCHICSNVICLSGRTGQSYRAFLIKNIILIIKQGK